MLSMRLGTDSLAGWAIESWFSTMGTYRPSLLRSTAAYSYSTPGKSMTAWVEMTFTMPWLVSFSFVVHLVLCQAQSTTTTTSALSDTSDRNISENGMFTSPPGGAMFDQGNSIVIQWESSYTNINLYCIWRGNRSVELADRQCLIASMCNFSWCWSVCVLTELHSGNSK